MARAADAVRGGAFDGKLRAAEGIPGWLRAVRGVKASHGLLVASKALALTAWPQSCAHALSVGTVTQSASTLHASHCVLVARSRVSNALCTSSQLRQPALVAKRSDAQDNESMHRSSTAVQAFVGGSVEGISVKPSGRQPVRKRQQFPAGSLAHVTISVQGVGDGVVREPAVSIARKQPRSS